MRGLTRPVRFFGSAVMISSPSPSMRLVSECQNEFLIIRERRSTGFSVRRDSSSTMRLRLWSRARASSCSRLESMYVPRMSKVLNPLLVAVPRAIILGPASVTLIWKSPSVSSCSSTTRMVSSTSMRNRRGAVTAFSSCDIRRFRECESSSKAGAFLGLYP